MVKHHSRGCGTRDADSNPDTGIGRRQPPFPNNIGTSQRGADSWLEACVYARLLSMAMHAYARLHLNTPHACVRLGSGTQRWASCIVMHRFSAEKKLVLVEFLFKSTMCRKGT